MKNGGAIQIYVEGPSDVQALAILLEPLRADARRQQFSLKFTHLGGKAAVLESAPRKAAHGLVEPGNNWFFALPDLYPFLQKGPNAHSSFEKMRGIAAEFS